MILLHVALFILWLTTVSLSTPLQKNRPHPKHTKHAPRSLHNFDKQTALAARAAMQRKFQNAPALLAGLGTCPGYAIPSSLLNTYNRASDYATNITLLSTLLKSSPGQSLHLSPAIRVAVAASSLNTNTTAAESLQDETDGIDDYEYYGAMNFGSQAQPLKIDFDTGSADLWVPVNCSNCHGLSSFQTNASSTYQNTNRPFAISYGSGAVEGTLAQDTISLAQLVVHNQSFGAVSTVSANFANSPNDGLLGMAFGTIANSQQPTLFENLIPQLAAPLFSVYMTRGQVNGSEIYLGGIDASRASDNSILWVPVVSKTYWTVAMTAASVNDMPIKTGNLNAIVDTGTSFIYIPSHIATPLYKLIPGATPAPDYGNGFYAYPCDSLVRVSFTLGPHELVLDPRDLNLGKYDPSSSTCIAALVDAGPNFDFAILGDSFLKSYLSIFDYSHGARVGFVKSMNE